MLCPACGGFTRNSKSCIHHCLSCHRRWRDDGSEFFCPTCIRCGSPTAPGGRGRWRCLTCGLQSTMDERAHVNRRKRYPPCPHCGDVGIKHGTTWGGTQRWYCKTCQREYTEKRPRCPYCGGRATKNGTVDGKQAWRCNDCSKQFIAETPVRADLRKKDTFVRTPKFFPDVDAILRYEPPAYCKPGMQCSRCPHLLECGENHGQLLCEGAFAVQVGGEVRVW